ncbi:MAG: HTH domain-containing protein [Anaerovoracaceae bacterium]|jgi:DeoR/GlpR family transcriptional regulator of sugar metabolism
MEKTVTELAAELNLSRQTIYRRLKKVDPKGDHTRQKDGKTYITEQGQQLIADQGNQAPGSGQAQATDQTTRDYIATLKAQLDEKDQHIKELTSLLRSKDVLLAGALKVDLLEAETITARNNRDNSVTADTGQKAPLRQRFRKLFNR